MNLHSIRFAPTRVALWLTAYGGNGRRIGEHLWELPEGTPPDVPVTRPTYTNANWWTPPRLNWHAYNPRNIFNDGYVAPLCGHRSQSRRPRISAIGYPGHCGGCISAAQQRGIVPLTYNQAQELSPQMALLQAETAEWQAAGRPSPWPSPSET